MANVGATLLCVLCQSLKHPVRGVLFSALDCSRHGLMTHLGHSGGGGGLLRRNHVGM